MAAATTRVEAVRDGGLPTELQAGPSRTLRGRLSRGHVVMVIAGLVGVVLSFAALREHDGNARVLVAAHEIRAGETVEPADFRSEAVTMGSALLATAVRAHDAATVRGKVAASTIAAGELVVRRTLRPRAARHGLRAMSIPIDPARAVGGRLAAGDRVDVLFAGTRRSRSSWPTPRCSPSTRAGRGGIGESASPFTVTVAVSAAQSQLLAAAIADGDLSITRTTGARPAAGTAPQSLDRVGAVRRPRPDGAVTVVEPTVALVFSPEPWVEELHRHLAHHGGAGGGVAVRRVRQVVVEPAVALDEEYDALVVSDRWPALTLGFVRAVHGRGRRVVGVFDPEEPAGKDHLLALGVDATIAGDSPMAEFVDVLADLDISAPHTIGAGADTVADAGAACDRRLGPLVVVSGPRGSGVTEVAVTLAAVLAARRAPVVLVDAHEVAPSVAGRLGLDLEPNLRSAIDACAHGLGDARGHHRVAARCRGVARRRGRVPEPGGRHSGDGRRRARRRRHRARRPRLSWSTPTRRPRSPRCCSAPRPPSSVSPVRVPSVSCARSSGPRSSAAACPPRRSTWR